MSNQATSSMADSLTPKPNFLSLGSELLTEVQTVVGHSKVRALRFKLGGHTVKEVEVSPATAVATVVLVVLAVIVSNLRVEVVKDALERSAKSGGNA